MGGGLAKSTGLGGPMGRRGLGGVLRPGPEAGRGQGPVGDCLGTWVGLGRPMGWSPPHITHAFVLEELMNVHS